MSNLAADLFVERCRYEALCVAIVIDCSMASIEVTSDNYVAY